MRNQAAEEIEKANKQREAERLACERHEQAAAQSAAMHAKWRARAQLAENRLRTNELLLQQAEARLAAKELENSEVVRICEDLMATIDGSNPSPDAD